MQARQLMQLTPRSPRAGSLSAGAFRWGSLVDGGVTWLHPCGGAHRLSIIEPLIRQASSLRIWVDQDSSVSAWIVGNPSGTLMLMLSPDLDRGFSGEDRHWKDFPPAMVDSSCWPFARSSNAGRPERC